MNFRQLEIRWVGGRRIHFMFCVPRPLLSVPVATCEEPEPEPDDCETESTSTNSGSTGLTAASLDSLQHELALHPPLPVVDDNRFCCICDDVIGYDQPCCNCDICHRLCHENHGLRCGNCGCFECLDHLGGHGYCGPGDGYALPAVVDDGAETASVVSSVSEVGRTLAFNDLVDVIEFPINDGCDFSSQLPQRCDGETSGPIRECMKDPYVAGRERRTLTSMANARQRAIDHASGFGKIVPSEIGEDMSGEDWVNTDDDGVETRGARVHKNETRLPILLWGELVVSIFVCFSGRLRFLCQTSFHSFRT